MERGRRLFYALLTAVALVAGLLVLRLTARSASSVTYEFLANRLTYAYVFVATVEMSVAASTLSLCDVRHIGEEYREPVLHALSSHG